MFSSPTESYLPYFPDYKLHFFSIVWRRVDFYCEIIKIYKVISHVYYFYTDNYAVALYALLLTYKAIWERLNKMTPKYNLYIFYNCIYNNIQTSI